MPEFVYLRKVNEKAYLELYHQPILGLEFGSVLQQELIKNPKQFIISLTKCCSKSDSDNIVVDVVEDGMPLYFPTRYGLMFIGKVSTKNTINDIKFYYDKLDVLSENYTIEFDTSKNPIKLTDDQITALCTEFGIVSSSKIIVVDKNSVVQKMLYNDILRETGNLPSIQTQYSYVKSWLSWLTNYIRIFK